MRRGFTLMELMVVVVIAAIVFMSSMGDSQASAQEGIKQFANQFEADLSYARSLAIADPSDPVILKVSPAADKYWLARKSTPDTPIMHPRDRTPYVVKVGSAGRGALRQVKIVAIGFNGDDQIEFNSLGTIDQVDNAIVRVSVGKTEVDIEVCPRSTSASILTSKRPVTPDADHRLASAAAEDTEDATEPDAGGAGGTGSGTEQGNNNNNSNSNGNGGGGLIGGLLGGLGL